MKTKLAEAAEASRARAESMHRAFRYGGMILMAAMIAGAMLMVSRRLGPTEQPEQRDEPSTSAEDDVAQETDGREEPLSPDTLEFAPMDVAQLAERTMTDTPPPVEEVVVESLAELGSRAPEEFARHLRGWINAATARDNSGDESD
jgi:flagellar biosynthesis/type III secretory pathway M-ring protein FliF/YscJ